MRNFSTAIPFIVLFANLVGCSPTEPTMDYSRLVSEIKAGNVRHVEIQSGSVVAELKRAIADDAAGNLAYRVILPPGADGEFEVLLKKAGVSVSVADY